LEAKKGLIKKIKCVAKWYQGGGKNENRCGGGAEKEAGL
jgi:hypothetical protein